MRMIHAKPGHQRAQGDGAKCGHLLRDQADDHLQRNNRQGPGHEDQFGVRLWIDVVVNVERQDDEFLPVDDPVSRKNEKKQHEARVGEHGPKILCGLRQADGRLIGAAGFLEKQQHAEEHGKHAEGSDAENVLHAHVAVDIGRDVRPCSNPRSPTSARWRLSSRKPAWAALAASRRKPSAPVSAK